MRLSNTLFIFPVQERCEHVQMHCFAVLFWFPVHMCKNGWKAKLMQVFCPCIYCWIVKSRGNVVTVEFVDRHTQSEMCCIVWNVLYCVKCAVLCEMCCVVWNVLYCVKCAVLCEMCCIVWNVLYCMLFQGRPKDENSRNSANMTVIRLMLQTGTVFYLETRSVYKKLKLSGIKLCVRYT